MKTGSPEEKSETVREKCLRGLKELRYDFIDRIPEGVISVSDPDYHRYKCRTNFYCMVRNELLAIRRKGICPTGLESKIDEFDQYVRRRGHALNYNAPTVYFLDFQLVYSAITTKEDIDYVNSILDLFINSL